LYSIVLGFVFVLEWYSRIRIRIRIGIRIRIRMVFEFVLGFVSGFVLGFILGFVLRFVLRFVFVSNCIGICFWDSDLYSIIWISYVDLYWDLL